MSTIADNETSETDFFSPLRPYAQSKFPMLTLGSIFGASALIPPRPGVNIPPFIFRAGFSAIYGGAAYVLSTGDIRNGSGIATAWCLAYLMTNARQTLTAPRHPVGLLLTGGVTACAALYGTEYFVYQE